MANKDTFYRRLNALGFLLCLGTLIYLVATFQSNEALVSPLSSFVRLALLGSSAIFFLALIHNPKSFGQRFYHLLNKIVIAAVGSVSAYHLWIHSKPNFDAHVDLSMCNMPLEQLMNSSPHILDKLFHLAVYCPSPRLPEIPITFALQSLILATVLFIICWKIFIYKQRNQGLFL